MLWCGAGAAEESGHTEKKKNKKRKTKPLVNDGGIKQMMRLIQDRPPSNNQPHISLLGHMRTRGHAHIQPDIPI